MRMNGRNCHERAAKYIKTHTTVAEKEEGDKTGKTFLAALEQNYLQSPGR